MNSARNICMIRRVFMAMILSLLCFAALRTSAFASTIIGIDEKQALYTIDSDTSVATPIFAGQNKISYAVAQCADGMIYFTDGFAGTAPINLYRFNPATPATPPVSLGNLFPNEMTRAACHPTTGKLYFMEPDPRILFEVVPGPTSFTISQQTLTLPVTTPPALGGGDIAFSPNGILYWVEGSIDYNNPDKAAVAASTRLWTINLPFYTVSNIGAISGLPSLVHGLAFDEAGGVRIAVDQGDPNFVLYKTPITGGAATPVVPSGMPLGRSMKDLASAFVSIPQPSITLVKSSTAFSDPFNGMTTPKRIPGGVVTYSIVTSNTGQGSVDIDTTILTDPIPVNTDIVVSNFGGAGSGPIAFANGSPTSGLTYTFTALSSTTDDVTFFTDAACTAPVGGVTPVADANGVDTSIRCIRVNPKGVFAADDAAPPSPNFTISFRVRMR